MSDENVCVPYEVPDEAFPRLLAKTVAGAAESFLVAAVKPNLTETAKGVGRFLESEARKKA